MNGRGSGNDASVRTEFFPEPFQKDSGGFGEYLIFFPDDAGAGFQRRIQGTETELVMIHVSRFKSECAAQSPFHQQRGVADQIMHRHDIQFVKISAESFGIRVPDGFVAEVAS